MTDPARITAPDRRPEDLDAALRPRSLDEFVGQQAARENLRVFIAAAKERGDPLDHVLFFGPEAKLDALVRLALKKAAR